MMISPVSKKLLVTSTATVILAVLVFSCRPAPRDHAGHLLDQLKNELNLTKEQQDKLAAIKDEILARKKAMASQHQKMKQQLVQELRAEQIDPRKIKEIFSAYDPERLAIRQYMVEKFSEFHATLTPAQKEKIAALFEKSGDHFQP